MDRQITRQEAVTPLMEIASRLMAALIVAPGTTEAIEANRINEMDVATVAVKYAQALLVAVDKTTRRPTAQSQVELRLIKDHDPEMTRLTEDVRRQWSAT